MMTLSSILKQNGHTVNLLITGRLSLDECIEKVKMIGPDVIAYSLVTGEHTYHVVLNAKIKKSYSCFSAFGGPYPTYMPDIIELDGVDAVCRGEGDIFFPELLDKMSLGKDYFSTPNFWLKKPNGTVVKNGIGPLVENLDELPFPDRGLVYDADGLLRIRNKKNFMAMRGCPYHCTYCFNHIYNQMTRGKGAVLRYRSVENVISEIRAVKKAYPLGRVCFEDDTFLLKPPGWLEAFAYQYAKEINLPLTCNVRCDLINEDNVRLLQQMGCVIIFTGVEAYDHEIRKHLLNRDIPMDQTLYACNLLKKYGIKVATQNLVGLPVDDPLELALTALDFNIKLKPYIGSAYMLYPYPKTEIRHIAIEKKMFSPDHNKPTLWNRKDSALTFRDKKTKTKLINLMHLFNIIVRFPFLRPLTSLLIALPTNLLYRQIHYAFFGYKLLMADRKDIFQTIWRYLPYYFKTYKIYMK